MILQYTIGLLIFCVIYAEFQRDDARCMLCILFSLPLVPVTDEIEGCPFSKASTRHCSAWVTQALADDASTRKPSSRFKIYSWLTRRLNRDRGNRKEVSANVCQPRRGNLCKAAWPAFRYDFQQIGPQPTAAVHQSASCRAQNAAASAGIVPHLAHIWAIERSDRSQPGRHVA